MNTRGARTNLGINLAQEKKRKNMSIRCTTKREVGLQNLGSRGGSPATNLSNNGAPLDLDLPRN